ncbi:hypothetical protein HAX54_029129 [Datura stramonium]|uniref:Uncharacterized protein n=1 Tax=Datura stramonium TaxID=4076 RepID=A0ABS8SA43_DATST|nr:hypothetical protein [Datura stramonium]
MKVGRYINSLAEVNFFLHNEPQDIGLVKKGELLCDGVTVVPVEHLTMFYEEASSSLNFSSRQQIIWSPSPLGLWRWGAGGWNGAHHVFCLMQWPLLNVAEEGAICCFPD